jgi:hypothetical protein
MLHGNCCCLIVHFFEKKDMIFPCPAVFLPLDVLETLTAGFFFRGGAGSSSENDSHTGSSIVTVERHDQNMAYFQDNITPT